MIRIFRGMKVRPHLCFKKRDGQIRRRQAVTSKKAGLFRALLSCIDREKVDPLADEQIDGFVTTIEPKLKGVRGYRKNLHEPFQLCLKHCRALVAEIPGPIYLKRAGYYEDSFIKAAFAGSEGIEDLLKNADRKLPKEETVVNQRFAFLTMTSREKTIFGSKRQGDMIVGDAAMRAITFTDHNLVGLAATLEKSKQALVKYCLEIIAEAAARHLSEMRTKVVDLRERQERLRAMNKMFGGGTGAGMGAVFVPFDPEKQQKQKQLEQMLIENENELAVASGECQTPEDWIKIVRKFLLRPEDILSMRQVSLRLNWCNVLTEDPKEKADTITFATFTLADEMQREGVLVAYEQP